MSDERGSPSHRRSRTRRRNRIAPILGILALLWLALAAWAFASPVGSSPDDGYHIAMIYCDAGALECTREGTRVDACYRFDPAIPGSCEATGALSRPPGTGVISGWYPPLYYAASSLMVGDTVAQTTIFVRLLNLTLAVAVLAGSVALSRPSLRGAVALSWLVASVPMGVFVFASINPSAWAVMGIAGFWGPLLSFLTGDGWTRLSLARLAFVQVTVLMALGSRSEPPIYIGVTVVALSVFAVGWPLHRTTAAQLRRLLVPAVLGLQALLALMVFTPAKQSAERSPDATAAVAPWRVLTESLGTPSRLLADPLLGWLDTPVPPLARAAVTGAFVAACLIGLGTLYARKVWALVVFGGLTWAFLLYIWATASSPNRMQPRYFLPLLFVLAGLALLPRLGLRPRWPSPVQSLLLALAVALANALSLLNNLVRYVSGLDLDPASPASPGGLAAAGEPSWWWQSLPLSPTAVWWLGSIAFTLAAVAAVLLLPAWSRGDRRPPAVAPAPRPATAPMPATRPA
mgnify:CR=1 FL=1